MDSYHKSPTFDDVADFVREWAHVAAQRQIELETQFERDLGITGDDGSELLDAAQKRFGVNLTRETLGLGPGEYLFNSEGFGLGAAFVTLFTNPCVRDFEVGELYQAMVKAGDPKPDPGRA